jgi:hypothetical protein
MDKSILVELCENLQEMLNLQEQVVKKPATHKVELVSQLKPDNYWLPMMHLGTSKTVSDEIKNAWFVEVYVDGKCIFRESYLPRKSEDLKIVEGMLITRVLKNVFCYGIMSSKHQMETMSNGMVLSNSR